MEEKPNVLKRWFERGNAIAEYMPTLTLIGAFSISVLIVVGRDIGRTYETVNCGIADASGEVIECPNGGEEEEVTGSNPGLDLPDEEATEEPTPEPEDPPECPADIDFDGLPAGTILSNQFEGVTISAVARGQGQDMAMIFDSGNPTGGDRDLGAPHEDFGGPGEGNGGRHGEPGENSVPLGNVIIISEDGDSSDPDDNGKGGEIFFDFNFPANVTYMYFLDQDNAGKAATVILYDADDNELTRGQVDAPSNGDNGVFRLDLNQAGVHRMEVDLPGSGAIASVWFCE